MLDQAPCALVTASCALLDFVDMSWHATDAAKLMNSLQKTSGGKPGNWASRRCSPSTPQDKPRKDVAGTS
eukprot:5825425-Amphidinium_carterae.1